MIHLAPAEYVIYAFGGVRKTARILGRQPGAICKWRTRDSERTEKGSVPGYLHKRIVEKAKDLGYDITYQDLAEGREVPEDLYMEQAHA